MREIILYIHTQTQSVPVLSVIAVDSDERLREVAAAQFDKSKDYMRIEARENDCLLFSLERPQEAANVPPSR